MSSGETGPQEDNERLPERHEERASSEGADGAGRRENAAAGEPDVTLDVPGLGVEELGLKVSELRARISLQAELADVVQLNVGVDARLDDVELELKGLQARALLKANLENVRDILGKTLETMGEVPDLFETLAREADDTGGGLEGAAGEIQDSSTEVTEDDEDEADEDATPEGGSTGGPAATAAARRKAEELNVDLTGIEGSGSGGRVLVKDVRRAARGRG